MSKRIILCCDGSLEQGFRVALEVRSITTESKLRSGQVFTEARGSLPPAMELMQLLTSWQKHYSDSIGSTRIELENIGTVTSAVAAGEKCRQLAKELRRSFTEWLTSAQFQPIELRLREPIGLEDSVEIVLKTNDRRLHQLPWHFWNFINDYPQSEMLIGNLAKLITQPVQAPHHVRILAILGDRRGIDIEADRQLLANTPQAEVCFLVEPSREELNRHLWEKTWDVLFFAGHSNTEQQHGRIYLSAQESLTIDELCYGLRRAIAQGLQLAIFNSCDGLGLAYELEKLHIPHSIVMREPVPDRVALSFLKQFLGEFASGAPLHISVRQAREYLQGLEGEFACASWLPIIFQNSALSSLSWSALQGVEILEPPNPKKQLRNKQLGLVTIIFSFAIATLLITTHKKVKSVVFVGMAMEQEKHGDYPGALNNYSRAIVQSPMNSDTYKNRGILKYRHFNDISGAITDYSKAIELNPQSPYAYDHRGFLLTHKKNDTEAALADFNRAIEIDPKFVWSYYNRGVLKDKKKNDTDGALADYNKVIELDPKYVNAYYNRGVLRNEKMNDTDEALADFNKVIELDPKYINAYKQRGLLRLKMNDQEGFFKDQKEVERLSNLYNESAPHSDH